MIVYTFQSFGKGSLPFFDGRRYVRSVGFHVDLILNIMYYERKNHFQPILNLAGVLHSNFCIDCYKCFKNNFQHRCTDKCPKCLQTPKCQILNEFVYCENCNRDFNSPECFLNHLVEGSFSPKSKNSVCQKIYVCKKCTMFVKIDKKKDIHKCGFIICKICSKQKPMNHLCFWEPLTRKATPKNKDPGFEFLYIYFDLETFVSQSSNFELPTKVHTPNLCILQQSCPGCIENENILSDCSICGVRQHIYYKNNPISQFVNYLLSLDKYKKVIVLSHYGSGFDNQFILKNLVERKDYRVKPNIVLNGNKIILMTFLNIKFVDSFNYFHLPLSVLPKAYGLDNIRKGYFPHLFNHPSNENYIGPLPSIEMYSPDTLKEHERLDFLKWYQEKINSNYVFNFEKELIFYCEQDVKILRLSCEKFRKTFLKYSKVEPFIDACTIASTCLRVYRQNFLKKETIAVIPTSGYRLADNQSFKAIQWLTYMEKVLNRKIMFAARGREIRLRENILVDGFCESLDGIEPSICLQFHGDFYHGCVKCFQTGRNKILHTGHTFNELYEQTVKISNKIINNGYKLIEIWECEFDKSMKENKEMSDYINTHDLLEYPPLKVRDAFYGGRVENMIKAIKGKIKYVDFTSLYPYINKYGRYPKGHPTVFINDECSKLTGGINDISNVDGLISCKVLPPRQLYIPVLPFRFNGKLLFTLCRSCAEKQDKICLHENDDERVLIGVWVSDELKKAVEVGYQIKKIFEIWKYEMTQYNPRTKKGGLFADYINQFSKIKIESSGYPDNCVSEENKDDYIKIIEEKEGVKLEKENIKFNPGKRSVAKLSLNSLWGKLGENEEMSKTEIVKEPSRFFEMLQSSEIDVKSILPIDDDIMYVNFIDKKEAVTPSRKVNVVVALFTTALARLKLYSILKKLNYRVYYCDTDSCMYESIEKPGVYEPPLGPLLGDLTDELISYGKNSFIEELVVVSPKFYALKIKKCNQEYDYVCKVKGIRLTFQNTMLLNFESIKKLVTNDIEKIVITSTMIRSTQFHTVISRDESKTAKCVYSKRIFEGLDKSIPYGYKK